MSRLKLTDDLLDAMEAGANCKLLGYEGRLFSCTSDTLLLIEEFRKFRKINKIKNLI